TDCIPLILSLTMVPHGAVKELKIIGKHYDESIYEKVMLYNSSLFIMPRHLFFPLLQIALPRLTRLPDAEVNKLMMVIESMVHDTDNVPLYEYCLSRLLKTYLSDAKHPGAAIQHGDKSLNEILPQASKLLAIISKIGQPLGNGESAYLAGMKLL